VNNPYPGSFHGAMRASFRQSRARIIRRNTASMRRPRREYHLVARDGIWSNASSLPRPGPSGQLFVSCPEKGPFSLARHFSEMQSCSIDGKVHPGKAERQSGPILSAKVVESRTPKQITVFAKLVCAFWRGRIQVRRRVVYLACSCSGGARLRRIDLIHQATSVCPARVVGMI